MEDVILINPATNDLRYLRGGPKISYRRSFIEPVLPHLGLASLASALTEKGFSVKIIDGNLFYLNKKEIIALLVKNKPKCIGVSVNIPTLPAAYSFIKEFKKAQNYNSDLSQTKIIVGGIAVSSRPETVFELGADYGCLGEAENNLPLLCDYIIRQKADISRIKGLVYCSDKKRIIDRLQVVDDLDALPHPRYDLYLGADSLPSSKTEFLLMPIQFSRGCVYDCSFCPTSIFKNKGIRFRSVTKVKEEIDELEKRFDFQVLVFVDEIFTFDRARAIHISEMLGSKRKKFRWICETRVDLIDQNLISEMKNGGCQRIGFGVETGAKSLMANLNKDLADSDCQKAFDICKSEGIDTTAFLMVGLPSESKMQTNQTLSLPFRLNASYIRIQLLQLCPSTKLYRQALDSGMLEDSVWSEYMKGQADLPFYLSEKYSLNEILTLITKTYCRFYLDPRRLVRELDKRTSTFWLQQWWRFRVVYSLKRWMFKIKKAIFRL